MDKQLMIVREDGHGNITYLPMVRALNAIARHDEDADDIAVRLISGDVIRRNGCAYYSAS